MISQSRRKFLTMSSLLAAGISLKTTPIWGLTTNDLDQSGGAFLPDRADDAELQSLAQYAVDAARQAGASYADIRLGESQSLSLELPVGAVDSRVAISSTRNYGLRALVDGVWGFTFGVILTPDRLVQSAREAVSHARHQAMGQSRGFTQEKLARVDLVPHQPLRGTWETPVTIDPFTVPLKDQIEQLGAYNGAMQRVIGAGFLSSLHWRYETRIFASSEGSLLLQRFTRANPAVLKSGTVSLPNFGNWSGGFERLQDPELVERIKEFADEEVHWDTYPEKQVDVGRYPLVMDGRATAQHAIVLARACELDRVLGSEADTVGTSFLTPVDEVLKSQVPIFSPYLTLSVSPTKNSSVGAQWDDEGVAITPYSLIRDGQVVDYVTTRETGSQIFNRTMLRGGLHVAELNQFPMTLATELTVTQRTQGQNSKLDDFIREVDNGLFMRRSIAMADPTLATTVGYGELYVIKKGQIVGKAPFGTGLSYRTQRFWKEQLTALGNESTMHQQATGASKGIPWQGYQQLITAPSALFKNVDVINCFRT